MTFFEKRKLISSLTLEACKANLIEFSTIWNSTSARPLFCYHILWLALNTLISII